MNPSGIETLAAVFISVSESLVFLFCEVAPEGDVLPDVQYLQTVVSYKGDRQGQRNLELENHFHFLSFSRFERHERSKLHIDLFDKELQDILDGKTDESYNE